MADMRPDQAIAAGDFAATGIGVGFDIDIDRAAAALRRLAGQIERGDVCLLKARVIGSAEPKEFATTRLVLTYSERT